MPNEANARGAIGGYQLPGNQRWGEPECLHCLPGVAHLGPMYTDPKPRDSMKRSRIAVLFLLAVVPAAFPQTAQPQDEDYAKLVKQWTTKPEFMSPLVDHLPKVAGVPTTKDVLGYYAGAPKKLTRVADLGRLLPGARRCLKARQGPAGRHDGRGS